MRRIASMMGLFFAGSSAFAQMPAAGWPSPFPVAMAATSPLDTMPIAAIQPAVPAAPSQVDNLSDRVAELIEPPRQGLNGQQHWFALNVMIGQPSAARVAVKVLSRTNNSLWLEAYGGSMLFNGMYGFGARLQHTALTIGQGDTVFISPGLGLQILPDWYVPDENMHDDRRHHGTMYGGCGSYSTLYNVAADVDFSWLHDFSPHFGFELGLKLGIATRVSGTVGDDYPSGLMWGKTVSPLVALYSGFRF